MQNAVSKMPWREREFVTIKEAADILARSPAWVQDRIDDGSLRCYRWRKGGPKLIAVWSVQALIDCAVPVRPRPARNTALHLVVNNT